MRALAAVLLLSGCSQLFGIKEIPYQGDGGTGGDVNVTDDGSGAGDGGGDGGATLCAGVAPTCGPTQTSPCCETTMVPGGTFARSYDVSGDGMYPDSSHPATVSKFRLDKYLITVGRFRQFVLANGGTQANPPSAGAGGHTAIANSGWDAAWNTSLTASTAALKAAVKCDAMYPAWTDAAGANENRPMNCITWYEAMAFCAWDGGFLPTEAEWNFAASGGSEQRTYPWSVPPGSVVIDNTRASINCMGDGLPACSFGDLLPVGSRPAGDGRWGHSDMAGNVYEWILDWHKPAYTNPCVDCAVLTATAGYGREARGGPYYSAESLVRTGSRYAFDPTVRVSFIGARCARTP